MPGDVDLCNGISEINNGDYINALKFFERACSVDNEYGLVFAASFYFMGIKSGFRNTNRAVKLFEKAASKWDNCVAQYMLGMLYLDGQDDINPCWRDALHWLKKSAENSWTLAQARSGLINQNGDGLPKDFKKSAYYYEKVVAHEYQPFDCSANYDLFGNSNFKVSFKGVSEDMMIKVLITSK
jgi:TPR repeat protein